MVRWVLWGMTFLTFTILIYNTYKEIKTGEMFFLFGYRPFIALSDSMEPTIRTNGLILAKEVTEQSELSVGDIITFHSNEFAESKRLTVTHRICEIEEDRIYTKGDHNEEPDGIPLTMENVDAKVVKVFNQPAWVLEKLQTVGGKLVFIVLSLLIMLVYYLRVSD